MWTLIIILFAKSGNYVSTTAQYTFDTQKACIETREAIVARLDSEKALLTKCIADGRD